VQRVLELALGFEPGQDPHHVARERPPDHRRDLRDRLLVAEPVEPRHQRVVQRGGDRLVRRAGLARVARELAREQRVASARRTIASSAGSATRPPAKNSAIRRVWSASSGPSSSSSAFSRGGRANSSSGRIVQIRSTRTCERTAVRELEHLELLGSATAVLEHEHERLQLAARFETAKTAA
jgi:hypothetical protein